MKYSLDDKPKLGTTLLYGLQWWIVILPSIITMGLVVGKLHYEGDVASQIFYMQKLFFVLGITLFVQILWGHRLPLVIGPASVLLIGILSSFSAGIPAIYTAVMIGGVLLAIVSASGLLKYLRKIFTSRIIAIIMILIPITLGPTIIRLVFGNDSSPLFNLGFVVLLSFALLIINHLSKGIWKSTTLLFGIVIGSLVYYLFHRHGAEIDINNTLVNSEKANLFIRPDFDLGVIFSFLFCAVVLIINEIGSIESIGHMLKADNMEKRNKWGVFFNGLSNILSGSIGVIGSVDYSSSPGMIASTRCASRFTFIPAAILLIICALVPPFIRVLLHIPAIIMGTILLYVMTTQLAAGIQIIVRDKAVESFEDGIILGMPIMIALLVSFMPQEASAHIPEILRPILSNGFVMGIFSVLILEHLVFRKKVS